MSKIIASAAIRGAHKIYRQAEERLKKAIEEKGEDCQVEFPNTGYYIPIIYSMLGHKVQRLGDFKPVLERAKELLPPFVEEEVWVPGKQDRGNLGEVTRSLDEWSQGVERHAVEGILSTAGGHCVEDRARVYWNRRFGWPEDMSGQVDFDGYFFAYGDDYKAALRDFVAVFGKIPMVPRWVFGFWYSRWYAYRADEFIELAGGRGPRG